MIATQLEARGMTRRVRKGAFTLYTHLSWSGRLVLGETGSAYAPGALDICPDLSLGAVGMVLEEATGRVVIARADHGNRDHPVPGADQCLLLATANPAEFTPRAFDAIAAAMAGGDDVPGLPEVQSANARYFISRLRALGIGEPSARLA